MSVIREMCAKTRWHHAVIPLALAIAAQAARAEAPQEPKRSSVVRARACSNCVARDSLQVERKHLLTRVDSLRWEIENRRLTDADRARMSRQMTETILALEEATMRLSGELMATEARAAITALRAEEPMTVTEVRSARRAAGYIGVTFDGAYNEIPRDGQMYVRFYQYPRIALVEASSPAERAGIAVGDTLVALNGDDVREQEFVFSKLLVPNNRVTMRLRRDGGSRDVRVTVAPAPPEYVVRRIPSQAPSVSVATPAPRSPRAPAPSGQVGAYGASPGVVAQGSGSGGYVYWFGNNALAGARLQTITEGLARAMREKEGVLILGAVPGLPAFDSGLREGDIVVRAGHSEVRTIADLTRAVTRSEAREIRLVVVSEGKRRNVTLRW